MLRRKQNKNGVTWAILNLLYYCLKVWSLQTHFIISDIMSTEIKPERVFQHTNN